MSCWKFNRKCNFPHVSVRLLVGWTVWLNKLHIQLSYHRITCSYWSILKTHRALYIFLKYDIQGAETEFRYLWDILLISGLSVGRSVRHTFLQEWEVRLPMLISEHLLYLHLEVESKSRNCLKLATFSLWKRKTLSAGQIISFLC